MDNIQTENTKNKTYRHVNIFIMPTKNASL